MIWFGSFYVLMFERLECIPGRNLHTGMMCILLFFINVGDV